MTWKIFLKSSRANCKFHRHSDWSPHVTFSSCVLPLCLDWIVWNLEISFRKYEISANYTLESDDIWKWRRNDHVRHQKRRPSQGSGLNYLRPWNLASKFYHGVIGLPSWAIDVKLRMLDSLLLHLDSLFSYMSASCSSSFLNYASFSSAVRGERRGPGDIYPFSVSWVRRVREKKK